MRVKTPEKKKYMFSTKLCALLYFPMFGEKIPELNPKLSDRDIYSVTSQHTVYIGTYFNLAPNKKAN